MPPVTPPVVPPVTPPVTPPTPTAVSGGFSGNLISSTRSGAVGGTFQMEVALSSGAITKGNMEISANTTPLFAAYGGTGRMNGRNFAINNWGQVLGQSGSLSGTFSDAAALTGITWSATPDLGTGWSGSANLGTIGRVDEGVLPDKAPNTAGISGWSDGTLESGTGDRGDFKFLVNAATGKIDNAHMRVIGSDGNYFFEGYEGTGLVSGNHFNVFNWGLKVVGDVSLYRKGYFSDLPGSRELAWGRTAIGLRHLGQKTFFDLRLKTDVTDYISDDQAAYGNGGELLFIYAPIAKLQFLSRAGLERRDYKETTGRQGWYGWAGEYVRWLFENGNDITFGGRWLFADTANSNYGWNGWEIALNSTIKLPGDVDLFPVLSYRKEHYRGPATALELSDRKDDNLRAGLGVSWSFTPALSLDVLYQYTKNSSTSPLYDYDQHLVNVGMTWQF